MVRGITRGDLGGFAPEDVSPKDWAAMKDEGARKEVAEQMKDHIQKATTPSDDKHKFKDKETFIKWLKELKLLEAKDLENRVRALLESGEITEADAAFLLRKDTMNFIEEAQIVSNFGADDGALNFPAQSDNADLFPPGSTATPTASDSTAGGGSPPSYGGSDGGSSGGAPSFDAGLSYGGPPASYTDAAPVSYPSDGAASYSDVQPLNLDMQQILAPEGPVGRLGDPRDFFFTQFAHEKWNPNGIGWSSDCGPASLAMAAKAFGAFREGLDPDTMIVAARSAMDASADRHTGTGPDQVINGAHNLGLNSYEVQANLAGIDQVIRSGGIAVVDGNPYPYEVELGFQNKGNQLYANDGFYNGGHFISVVGIDQRTGNYIVNDPACKIGPIQLTRNQMVEYMQGQGGGDVVGIWGNT